jgi:hypothetical protein
MVGCTRKRTYYRMLKIERNSALELAVRDDPVNYTRKGIQESLHMIDEGNKQFGGLKKTCTAYGIVGKSTFNDCVGVIHAPRFC